jgi:tetratricopeptide (TPR) repeat protein
MRFPKTLLLAIALGALLLTTVGCKKKEPAQVLNDAIESAKRGDVYGATQKCESLIQANPESFESYQARFVLANCLVQSGDMEGARARWNEVFTKVPLQTEVAQNAYMNYLQSYIMEKKYADAIKVIDTTSSTLATAPDFANYMQQYKINLFIENKQPQEAEKLILTDVEATTSETLRVAKKNKLADFYVQVTKDYDKALDILKAQRAAATDEKEIQMLVRQITGALGLQKKYDEAIAVFQDRVKNAKSDEDKGASLWGVAMMQRSKADEAKDDKTKEALKQVSNKTYQECIDQTRKSMDAEILNVQKLPHLQRISLLYQDMGDTSKSIETLSSYLETAKDDKTAWATLGMQIAKIYFSQKDFTNGKLWLKKTADALPNTQEGAQAMSGIAQAEKYEQMMAAQAATSGTLENKTTSGTQPTAPISAGKQ